MLKRKFMAALAVTAALCTAVSGMGVSTFADESEPAAVGSLSDGIGSIKPIDDVPGPSITPSPDRRSTGQINKQDTTNADTKTNHTGNSTDSDQKTADAVPMYRLYNPNSGEHFYTASVSEKNYLAKIGWHYEGIGWYAPKNGDPVYRLYNKNGGEHHYTMKKSEKDSLVRLGWEDEGIGWYSDSDKTIPLYRQYNPNTFSNNHNYTTSTRENDYLISIGWKPEGIGWYGMDSGRKITKRINAYDDFTGLEGGDRYIEYLGTPDEDLGEISVYFGNEEHSAEALQYDDVELTDTGLKGTVRIDAVNDRNYGGHLLTWKCANATEDIFNRIIENAKKHGWEAGRRTIAYGYYEYVQIHKDEEGHLSVTMRFEDNTIEIQEEGD